MLIIRPLVLLSMIALSLAFVPALVADDDDDKGPIQVGYVIVTPTSANTSGLVVFETFGERRGPDTTQAGVLPSEMTTNATIFVSTNGRLSRNLGVAIANPGSTDANVTLKLHKGDGTVIGMKTIAVVSRRQMAVFVTQMFENETSVPRDFNGILEITSDTAVAVVGLRFRGENFSTIPITNLSPPIPVPVVSAGVGGAAAVILAHFAANGGWATEIVIVNSGTAALTVRVDLFKQDGTPLTAKLNGESKSSFTDLIIPPFGVIVLSPRNQNGDSPF